MAPPPRPEVDKRSFGADFLRYHERLTPFFDGTIAALSAMAGLSLVTRAPIRVTVPDDWVNVTFAAGSGFVSPLGANQRLQYRTTTTGDVELRGVFGNTTTKPAGTLISALRPEVLTAARDVLGVYSESPASAGSLSISSSGLRYETGPLSAICTTGTKWTPKDRTPLPMGAPFPLQVSGPSSPSMVAVQSTLIGTDKRPTSQRRLHHASWTTAPERATSGFLLTRVEGLVVGATYDLMVYAAA